MNNYIIVIKLKMKQEQGIYEKNIIVFYLYITDAGNCVFADSI